ncbi:hypothetical protein [Agromyces aerolatus]|uniref:hypothetical protein n=1 Tax=Agromyces sp. LY-1074 TaxID=3074080 RepID=UPI002865E0E8|nr:MULTISPECIES: hypothetical protein [unclassified Agromyces]MDR5700276.1 hypothetical protein [Agromyces sp. LY-1074]MDR5706746.1 hypothetical protein [Agromyces sp. LY-1358]
MNRLAYVVRPADDLMRRQLIDAWLQVSASPSPFEHAAALTTAIQAAAEAGLSAEGISIESGAEPALVEAVLGGRSVTAYLLAKRARFDVCANASSA